MSVLLQTPWDYPVDQYLRGERSPHTLASHNLQEIECSRSYTLRKNPKKQTNKKKLQLGKKEKLGLEVPSSKILFLARKFYDYFLHEN